MSAYVFQRTYVDEKNIGFLKGSEAPGELSQEKIDKLVDAGILLKVEGVSEFLGEGDKQDEIEQLDPEKKVKGKKV